MLTSDFRPEVENMAIACMRNASGHNYRNSLFIVDLAMGQMPHSTERIFLVFFRNFGFHQGALLVAVCIRVY